MAVAAGKANSFFSLLTSVSNKLSNLRVFVQVGKTQGVDAMFEPKTGAQVEAVKKTLEAAAALRRDQEVRRGKGAGAGDS